MRNPLFLGGLAILVGLSAAMGTILYLKPQDRPIELPWKNGVKKNAPPIILLLGSPTASRLVHFVVGDDFVADRKAFETISAAIEQQDIALNIIPAVQKDTALYEGFAWALAVSGSGQAGFVEALLGTSGDLTPQVLNVIAQNNGLNTAAIAAQAKSSAVAQSLRQAHSVLPPATPALLVDGAWLVGDEISPLRLATILGTELTVQEKMIPASVPDAKTDVKQQQKDVSEARVVISDAYAFATPPKPHSGAIFLTLRNVGGTEALVETVSTPVAARAELHGHDMKDGVMSMSQVENITVPAGKTITLEPGGLHIMLFDLPAPLAVGQKFPLTLVMKGGVELSVLVTVTPIGQVLTDTPSSE